MSYNSEDAWFGEALTAAGWNEVVPHVEFRRGRQRLIFDTSSWIEIGTDTNPRIFDVPVPTRDRADWTINLIEHLLAAEAAKSGSKSAQEKLSGSGGSPKQTGWAVSLLVLACVAVLAWVALTLLMNNGFDFAFPA